MKIDRVGVSISPPAVQPQVLPDPIESEPEVPAEEDGGGKAKGAVSKLNEGDHFKGVADVRLRIVHFDNADLEKIDPALLPAPEDVPGKAYEKFLEQYRALYNASLPTPEPDAPVDEESVGDIPAPDLPPVIEESIVEVPPISEPSTTEVPVSYVPGAESVLLPPIEIEPAAATPEQTTPVDGGTGALSAFEEFLQTQASQEPGALDRVI